MEKRAQQHIYHINPHTILKLQAWSRHITQLWNHRFVALDTILEAEKKKA